MCYPAQIFVVRLDNWLSVIAFRGFFPTHFWYLMQLAQIDGEKRWIRAMNALCQN